MGKTEYQVKRHGIHLVTWYKTTFAPQLVTNRNLCIELEAFRLCLCNVSWSSAEKAPVKLASLNQ